MTAILMISNLVTTNPGTANAMTWSDFYLICFAVGFCFSFFSFVLGSLRVGHLPHFHGHMGGAHVPHAPVGHGTGTAPASGHGQAGANADAQGLLRIGKGSGVSFFNLPSTMAFLAWFGGTGYLLTRYSALWVGFGLLLAIGAGMAGAGIIFLFMSRVLMTGNEVMDPADYEMVGVLGRLCTPIREGGTGELIYSQMGTRRVCGARSEDESAIAKGTEVVVTRYEKGIAYVKLWSEMAGEETKP
jgi:hypothetical protein